MISRDSAAGARRHGCGATVRRSASASHGIAKLCYRYPRLHTDACDKRPGRVSSLSLVRCRGNDYSVPVA